MKLLDRYQHLLQNATKVVEAIAYTFCFLIITLSIFRSAVTYIREYNDPSMGYLDTRIDLGESIGASLSFILGAQIFKLFFITSYKQLVIVVTLVLVKMLVSYFLEHEIHQ